jgi:transposase
MRIWRMRTGISITVTPSDRLRLETLTRDRNAPQKQVWRAEIILLSADGFGTNEIIRRTGKSKTCVWRWQDRFMREGFEGLLHDKTRPSRIRPLGADVAARVVALTQTDPPGEATHWTATMMAKQVGISASSAQRIWRAHGLQPHRVRQFKLSNDPNFVEKLHDVVGLYVNPPEHAIVLSVDEKSQIQVLDRTQPGLPLKKGRAATMTHDYKRNGTTTLFAAFDVLEGKIIGRCMQKHRHQEFIRFLNQIEGSSPCQKGRPCHPRQLCHPSTRRSANGSIAIRVSPSISRPPPHRGSMLSKATSPNSPNGASNAASFDPSTNSELPSTASSMTPITIPSPSHGLQTQTKSSPPSNEGTNC